MFESILTGQKVASGDDSSALSIVEDLKLIKTRDSEKLKNCKRVKALEIAF